MRKPVKPSPRSLRVLYASGGGRRVDALCELLVNRGHEVRQVGSLRDVLLSPESHVLVLDASDRTPAGALSQLADVDAARPGIPIVLVVSGASSELCVRAAESGAVSVIQSAFHPRAFTDAVEGAAGDHSPDTPARIEHATRYRAADCEADQVIEDLCAFLREVDVAPAHRARIACAAAELVDNALRHAYVAGREGEIAISVALRGAHVRLEIEDDGVGMDARGAHLECVPAALPTRRSAKHGRSTHAQGSAPLAPRSGLARASKLADHLLVQSGEIGTRIKLAFELTPVRSVSEEFPASSAFRPESMRELLRSLESGESSFEELSPVMAPTVRRLLGRDRLRPLALRRV